MQITINISDVVVDAFKDNLRLDPEVLGNIDLEVIIKKVIKQYLNDSIDREDLDMYVTQYLDGLEESGELMDIIYESTLE